MSVREIFEELIKEAMKGNVVIGDKTYNVSFNTLLEDDGYIGNSNSPTLVVGDKALFFDYLAKYIDTELEERNLDVSEEKNAIKEMMTHLITSMTPVELNNPEECIRRRLEFLRDNSLADRKEITVESLDSNLVIEKQKNGLDAETAYRMSFTLENNGSRYHLPSIFYGIENGTCYIHDIRNVERNDDNDFTTRIKRTIDGMYDEEMENIPPSSVLVSELFLKELSRNGINNVRVSLFNSKDNNPDVIIRTFIRSMQDLEGVEIKSYPYETDEYLNIELGNVKSKDDEKKM